MKTLNLLLILLFAGAFLFAIGCLGGNSDTDDDDASDDDATDDDTDDDDEPYIVDTSNTDCKDYKDEEPEEGIEFNYEDGILTVVHVNAYYNCCIDRIDVQMQLENFTIDLYETEIVPMPCDCLCYFDVTTQIAALESGTSYTVNIYVYDALSISGEVTIP